MTFRCSGLLEGVGEQRTLGTVADTDEHAQAQHVTQHHESEAAGLDGKDPERGSCHASEDRGHHDLGESVPIGKIATEWCHGQLGGIAQQDGGEHLGPGETDNRSVP